MIDEFRPEVMTPVIFVDHDVLDVSDPTALVDEFLFEQDRPSSHESFVFGVFDDDDEVIIVFVDLVEHFQEQIFVVFSYIRQLVKQTDKTFVVIVGFQRTEHELGHGCDVSPWIDYKMQAVDAMYRRINDLKNMIV
jgi:hypothetical protein